MLPIVHIPHAASAKVKKAEKPARRIEHYLITAYATCEVFSFSHFTIWIVSCGLFVTGCVVCVFDKWEARLESRKADRKD